MTITLNETHDSTLTTWVSAAQADASDFPIQNLPFGRFSHKGSEQGRLGVAIADCVLDLAGAANEGLLDGVCESLKDALGKSWLNDLMSHTQEELRTLRMALSVLLRSGAAHQETTQRCLVHRADVDLLLPVDIRNFADFFTSIHHATNAANINNPGSSLTPNFHHIPMAYHGRTSTLSVSGTAFHRPMGQAFVKGASMPVFEPSKALDFECELGVYVGRGNPMGQRISLADTPDHIFGFSILNDWSARDIQAWETVPLGPFLGKNFISSLSPWVVTQEAMLPFRIPANQREASAPALLQYLDSPEDRSAGGLDIRFEISIRSNQMRAAGMAPYVFSRPKFKDHYWTVFQMLTHQTSNGCAALTGDLLGTGTVSGPVLDELGCIKEFTQGGKKPLRLPTGEERAYLADGDELILRAHCEREGFASIGFGSCSGVVLAALA